jgi:hypothetical protein
VGFSGYGLEVVERSPFKKGERGTPVLLKTKKEKMGPLLDDDKVMINLEGMEMTIKTNEESSLQKI